MIAVGLLVILTSCIAAARLAHLHRKMRRRALKLATWLEQYDGGFAARARMLTRPEHVCDFDWIEPR